MVPPSFFIFPRTARKEQPMKKQSPAHLPTPEEDTRIAMYREIVDDMLDAYQETTAAATRKPAGKSRATSRASCTTRCPS